MFELALSILSVIERAVSVLVMGEGSIQQPSEGSSAEDSFQLFSLRKPKDFKAGVASGTKNFFKGLFAGLIGVIANPAVGAYENGFKGLALGVVQGTKVCL